MTATAITDALDQNGVLFPGGSVTEGDQSLTVQTGAKLTSVDEIAGLPGARLYPGSWSEWCSDPGRPVEV